MTEFVLPRMRDYDELYREFRWQVPAHYNIGVDVCDRWAAAGVYRDDADDHDRQSDPPAAAGVGVKALEVRN